MNRHCPSCNCNFDVTTEIRGGKVGQPQHRPAPIGSIALCEHCGQIVVMGRNTCRPALMCDLSSLLTIPARIGLFEAQRTIVAGTMRQEHKFHHSAHNSSHN